MRGRDNVKDLGRLGRDLGRVVLVDDNAWSFLLQPANGVPAAPFLGSPHDRHARFALLYTCVMLLLLSATLLLVGRASSRARPTRNFCLYSFGCSAPDRRAL